jgi:hypothetical protein
MYVRWQKPETVRKAIISGPCSVEHAGKGNDWLCVSGGFSLVLSFSAKRKNK